MTPEQKAAARKRGDAWRLKNIEKVKEQKRKHYAKNRQKYLTIERDRQYRVRYGITLADYDRMLEEQDGKCQICSSERAGNTGQAFAVDHCHETLKVRGLLCIKCNARLGWFEKHQRAVLTYLEKSE